MLLLNRCLFHIAWMPPAQPPCLDKCNFMLSQPLHASASNSLMGKHEHPHNCYLFGITFTSKVFPYYSKLLPLQFSVKQSVFKNTCLNFKL